MKTAIICDWLVAHPGAEKFLDHMIQCFPEADLFAVVDFLPENFRHYLHNKSVKTTFIQKIPFAKKYYRQYLPLMPLAIEQLDLSDYPLIISSSHAVAKGVLTGPDQLHISYIHSPMRYAWDLQHQYLQESGLNKGIKGWLAKWILHKMRIWDQRTAAGVDHFIANSNYIARRIWKAYKREARVIPPPVNLERFTPYANKEDYYFTASRMVPYKRMDLIVESFTHLPKKKLIVIGTGPDFSKIQSIAKGHDNIQLLGYQPDDVLIHHLQRAKAFIFAAEEDFGLLPVEAQATGTPVIAFGKGGALETVKGLESDQPTGVFFREQSVKAICDAVQLFEENHSRFTLENCVNNSKQFSAEIFRERFKQFVMDACIAKI